jgi:hypothetical protein
VGVEAQAQQSGAQFHWLAGTAASSALGNSEIACFVQPRNPRFLLLTYSLRQLHSIDILIALYRRSVKTISHPNDK